MLDAKIRPNLCNYNLLIRCMRDCTFEKKKSSKTSKNVLSRLPKQLNSAHDQVDDFSDKEIQASQEETPPKTEIYQANDAQVTLHLKPSEVHVIDELKVIGESIGTKIRELEWWQKIDRNIDTSELLKPLRIHDADIEKKMTSVLVDNKSDWNPLEINDDTPYDRLNMIGNLEGLFKSMAKHKTVPDSKTFSILLQVGLDRHQRYVQHRLTVPNTDPILLLFQ
jgi:hypothetical protein